MGKSFFCLLFIVFWQLGVSQNKLVYLFPGQGSDAAIFSKLELKNCDTVVINYPIPTKKDLLPSYAKRLMSQIDTTHPFYFLGVSFGGMNAIEISKIIKPEKLIIISSAKGSKEIPFRYKFQRVVPMYNLFTGRFYKRMAKLARPIVEPDSREYDSIFRAMIDRKNPDFMKRSIKMICKWKNKENPTTIIHIHGELDHTIPFRKVDSTYKIENGSHMMVYTKAQELNELLNKILNE